MGKKKRILLLEDDQELALALKIRAEELNYSLKIEMDGINGFQAILRDFPDIVISDVLLPGKNGFDVCRELKNHSSLSSIPFILISGKPSDDVDQILSMKLGADYFLPKPFSLEVLFAKVEFLLVKRRKEPEKSGSVFHFGEFIFDSERYICKKNNQSIPLTLSEFGILYLLLSRRGEVFNRAELLAYINEGGPVVERNIDVHVASLRKKLNSSISWIETVRGVGYRFKEESFVPAGSGSTV